MNAKILPLALCLILVLAAACSRRETPAEAGARTGTLLLGNGAEPQDLDPQIVTGYSDCNILISLFEGLTCIDEATSRAVPGAASRWEITPDGLTYTFHLRPGLVWSNGDAFTAEDFRYSIRRILAPKLAAEYAYLFFALKNAEAYAAGKITDFSEVGVAVPDPLTLQLTLGAPCPYLPDLTAHQAWYPVHRATVEKFGGGERRGTAWTRPENIVTNGPFVLREWKPNAQIRVERNPRYWDVTHNRLNAVVFYPNDNGATDESDFRAGQLHATFDLQPDRIAHYRQTAPAQLRVDPFSESNFLRFNLTKPPFNDERVRQALSRAIDRVALTRDVLNGSREPAYTLTPATAGYRAGNGAPTDPAAARRLLAEAGYPGGKGFPVIDLLFWTDSTNTKLCEALQQMWRRELGITVHLVTQEHGVYVDSERTLSYQVARARWIGDYNDPSNYLDLFIGGGGNNQTGWANTAYDQLTHQADRTMDPVARFGILRQAEALLLQACPIAPLYFGSRTYLLQPYVKGWVPSLLGIHRYQYVWFQP
jgi:oligopeptide transport system substrate-binding protein